MEVVASEGVRAVRSVAVEARSVAVVASEGAGVDSEEAFRLVGRRGRHSTAGSLAGLAPVAQVPAEVGRVARVQEQEGPVRLVAEQAELPHDQAVVPVGRVLAQEQAESQDARVLGSAEQAESQDAQVLGSAEQAESQDAQVLGSAE